MRGSCITVSLCVDCGCKQRYYTKHENMASCFCCYLHLNIVQTQTDPSFHTASAHAQNISIFVLVPLQPWWCFCQYLLVYILESCKSAFCTILDEVCCCCMKCIAAGISIDKKMRCIWKRFGFSTYMDLSLLMSCIYIIYSARCKHKHRTHTLFVVPFKMAECILFIRMTRKTYHAMHFVMIVPISFCYGF